MPSPLSLILGTVTFDPVETPNLLDALGGTQMMAVHPFPGGYKTVQPLGAFPHELKWEGNLWEDAGMGVSGVKDNLNPRVGQIDQMRANGAAVSFSYGIYQMNVVVKEFYARPHTDNWIPYSIVLEVQQDNSIAPLAAQVLPLVAQNIPRLVPLGLQQAPQSPQVPPFSIPGGPLLPISRLTPVIGAGLGLTVGAVAALLSNPPPNPPPLVINHPELAPPAVASSTSNPIVAPATGSLIMTAIPTADNSVVAQFQAFQVSFNTALSQAAQNPNNIPNATLITLEASLTSMIQTMQGTLATDLVPSDQSALLDAINYLQAILDNTLPPPTYPASTIQVVNPNLYAVAAELYADATQWYLIANASGLLDPMPGLTNPGTYTLTIPGVTAVTNQNIPAGLAA